jgi:hypothetical protein
MLHRARHTHKLHLLNTRHERKKISAASARLPATILTVRLARRSGELTHFWRHGRPKALITKVATLACAAVANKVSRTPFMANLADSLFGRGHADARRSRLTLLLCRRACTTLCMADFSIYGLNHGLMKADRHISIKEKLF